MSLHRIPANASCQASAINEENQGPSDHRGLSWIKDHHTMFYPFVNFPGHHARNSLHGTPAPPGMASMQCTCKPSCASSWPCLGTATPSGGCLVSSSAFKDTQIIWTHWTVFQQITWKLETRPVANHYQPSDQWSFQCAAYSAVAVRSSLQHNWTVQRHSRWPGDSEQWMPKFLQPREKLATWWASNFQKKRKTTYSIIFEHLRIFDQYVRIWHLISSCFFMPHLELLYWFGPPPQSGPRDWPRSGPGAPEDPGVGGSQQIQLPAWPRQVQLRGDHGHPQTIPPVPNQQRPTAAEQPRPQTRRKFSWS